MISNQKILIKILDSFNTPTGNITILAIKADKIAQAIQLNHLKILELTFIFSELNQAKYKFGQIKMFNKEKKIEIRVKNSENIENLILCPKKDIINNVSQDDYNLYKKEKINYIKTFEHRKKIDFIYPDIFKNV